VARRKVEARRPATACSPNLQPAPLHAAVQAAHRPKRKLPGSVINWQLAGIRVTQSMLIYSVTTTNL